MITTTSHSWHCHILITGHAHKQSQSQIHYIESQLQHRLPLIWNNKFISNRLAGYACKQAYSQDSQEPGIHHNVIISHQSCKHRCQHFCSNHLHHQLLLPVSLTMFSKSHKSNIAQPETMAAIYIQAAYRHSAWSAEHFEHSAHTIRCCCHRFSGSSLLRSK